MDEEKWRRYRMQLAYKQRIGVATAGIKKKWPSMSPSQRIGAQMYIAKMRQQMAVALKR